MKVEDLLGQPGEWLKGTGPENDVVISSRVRLARNLADHRFTTRAADPEKPHSRDASLFLPPRTLLPRWWSTRFPIRLCREWRIA